jgi:hypothetical protein
MIHGGFVKIFVFVIKIVNPKVQVLQMQKQYLSEVFLKIQESPCCMAFITASPRLVTWSFL